VRPLSERMICAFIAPLDASSVIAHPGGDHAIADRISLRTPDAVVAGESA
jgi:hypothetical protein